MATFFLVDVKPDTFCSSSLITSSIRLHILSAGELLVLLNVSSDEKVLPTTYGELRPPLGKHRLKVSCYMFIVNLICMDVAIPFRTRSQFDQLRLNFCSTDNHQLVLGKWKPLILRIIPMSPFKYIFFF